MAPNTTVRPLKTSPELRVSDAQPKDAFDRWNERRDDVLEPHYYRGGGLLYGGYGSGYGGGHRGGGRR